MDKLREAQILAEKINLARCEGKPITAEQTVRLCELLDVHLCEHKDYEN